LPVAVSNNASPDGYLSIEQIVALPDTDSSEHSVENQKVESDVVCLSDQDEDRIIRFLYKQKVYGFPRSNGGYLSNFWHYFKNDHPLFSICLCHQLNPYTKRNRAIVYFCVTSMAYCLTVGLMETDYIMDNNVCRAGCDVTSSDSNGKCACSGGMNDGKSCSSFNYICDYISPIAVGALCGAFVVVYGATLRAFATFGCCQGNRSLQAKCASCISFASVFGGHVLTFFLGFSMCSLIVVLLVVEVDPQQHVRILYAFGVSKLLSAVYWFGFAIPWFICRFHRDKERFVLKARAGEVQGKLEEFSESPESDADALIEDCDDGAERSESVDGGGNEAVNVVV